MRRFTLLAYRFLCVLKRDVLLGGLLSVFTAWTACVAFVASHPLVSIRGSCTNIPTGFMNDVGLAYSVEHPEVALEQRVLLTAAAQSAQFANETDYSVITAVLSTDLATKNPDTQLLPLFTYALVPVYNLPGVTSGEQSLVLTRSVLARIFRGNITRWSDPAIAASNPKLASAALLPAQNITIVYTLTASGQQWAAGLALFDPLFVTAIGGNTRSPVWPTSKFARSKQVDTLVRTTATVAQTPYSISWSTFDVASSGGVPMAAMVNILGNTVKASASSLSYSTLTVAAGPNAVAGKLSSSLALSLTDAAGWEAWPLAFYAYVMVSRSTHRKNSDCTTKRALVDFLFWMYTSPAVFSLSKQHGLTMLPDLLFQQLKMDDVLSGLQCNGTRVYSSPSMLFGSTTSLLTGNSGVAPLLEVQLSKYARTVAATSVYEFQLANATNAWAQLDSRFSRINVAVPDLLRAQGLWRNEGYLSMPLYLESILPVASLPAAVSTAWSAATEALKMQYPLMPLRIELDVLGRIFGGGIASWLDPALVATNPHLPYWFNSTDPTLTMVVCCSDAGDPQFTTSLFLHSLSLLSSSFRTASGFTPSATNYFPTRPYSLFPQTADPATMANWIVVPTEDQLTYVTSLRLGSFSYQLSQGTLTDPQSPIIPLQIITASSSIAAANTAGASNRVDSRPVVEPNTENMLACLSEAEELREWADMRKTIDLFDVARNGQAIASLSRMALMPSRSYGVVLPAACYPFTQLVSLALPATFNAEFAEGGRELLRLLEWFNDGESSVGFQLSAVARTAVHLPTVSAHINRINKAAIAGVTLSESGQSLLYRPPSGHLFDQQALMVSFQTTGTSLSYLLAVIGAFVGFLLLEDPLFHAKAGKLLRGDVINVLSAAFVWSVAAMWPTFVLAANAMDVQSTSQQFDPVPMLTCALPAWGCLSVGLSIKLRSFGNFLSKLLKNKKSRYAISVDNTMTKSSKPSVIDVSSAATDPSTGASVGSKDHTTDEEDHGEGRRHSSEGAADWMAAHAMNPVLHHLRCMLNACKQTDVYSLVATFTFVAALVILEVMGLAALQSPARRQLDARVLGGGVAVVTLLSWLAVQLVFHLDTQQWTSSMFVALPIFAAHQFALRAASFTHDQDRSASYVVSGWDGTLLTLVSILLAAACCFVLIAVQFYRNKITSQGWLRQVVGLKRDRRRLIAQLETAKSKAAQAAERADRGHILSHLVGLLRSNNTSHLAAYAWSLTQGSTSLLNTTTTTTDLRHGDLAVSRVDGKSVVRSQRFPAATEPSSCSPPNTVGDRPTIELRAPSLLPSPPRAPANSPSMGPQNSPTQNHSDSPTCGPLQWRTLDDRQQLAMRQIRDDAAADFMPGTPMSGVTALNIPPSRNLHDLSAGGSPLLVLRSRVVDSTVSRNHNTKQQLLKAPEPSNFHHTLDWLQTSLAIHQSDATGVLPELDEILTHAVGIEMFRTSLRAQMSEECLTFYLYVRLFEQEPDATVRRELALDIYRLFVMKGASLEINLPSQISQSISEAIDADRFPRTLFDAAKGEVYYLMRSNHWNKFKASVDYKLLCLMIQQESLAL